jgi:hypothetical protein
MDIFVAVHTRKPFLHDGVVLAAPSTLRPLLRGAAEDGLMSNEAVRTIPVEKFCHRAANCERCP